MSYSSPKAAEEGSASILGHLDLGGRGRIGKERSIPIPRYRIVLELAEPDAELKLTTESTGRGLFLLRVDANSAARYGGRLGTLRCVSEDGELLSEETIRVPEPRQMVELSLPLPRTLLPRGTAPASTRDSERDRLRRFAEAEALRQAVPRARLESFQDMWSRVVPSRLRDPDEYAVPTWFQNSIEDLDRALELSYKIPAGDPTAVEAFALLIERPLRGAPGDRVRSLLGRKPAPSRGGFGGGSSFCFVDPNKAFRIAATGIALDVAGVGGPGRGGGEVDEFGSRALRFVEKRVGLLDRTMCLLIDIECERISPLRLEQVVLLAEELGQLEKLTPADRRGRTSDLVEPKPWAPEQCCGGQPAPAPPILGDGDPDLGFDPCEGLWIDCYREMQEVGLTLSQMGPVTATIGSVQPEAVCASALPLTVEIHPKPEVGFGDQDERDSELKFRSGGQSVDVTVVEWSNQKIVAELPDGLHSGYFYFSRNILGLTLELDACATFLGAPLPGELGPAMMFMDLIPPGPLETGGDGYLEIVQDPVIRSFKADDDADSTVAEACTGVSVTWDVDFGGGPYKTVDERSLDRIRVDIENDRGMVVVEDQPAHGIIQRSESDTEELTITARSEVGSSLCAEKREQLLIERFNRLHLRPDSIRLLVGASAMARVRRSCTGPEELEVDLVPSSAAVSVPSSVSIPSGEDEATFTVTGQGPCGSVEITAEAPGHGTSQLTINLIDTPVITGIDPEQVSACSTVIVEIAATCLDDDPSANEARLIGDGHSVSLEVLDVVGGQLRCRATKLLPGTYDVEVTAHGLTSDAMLGAFASTETVPHVTRLEAEVIAPIDATLQDAVLLCVENTIEIDYEVHKAERVTIARLDTGKVLEDQSASQACEILEGSFTATATQAVSFRLRAYPLGAGTPVEREIEVEDFHPYRIGSQVRIFNQSHEDRHIWLLKEVGSLLSAERAGIIEAEDFLDIDFEDCAQYSSVMAISPSAVAAYNESVHDPRNAVVIDDPEVTQVPDVRATMWEKILGKEGVGRFDPAWVTA